MALPSVEDQVRNLREQGRSYEQISKELNISIHSVRKALDPEFTRKWPSRSEATKRERVKINAVDSDEDKYAFPPKQTWNDWVKHLKTIQEFKNLDPSRLKDEVTIEFAESLPVGISIFSDIHCGDSGVLYNLLDKHVQLVKNTDGMYCVFNGDELNNFLGSLSYAARADLVQNAEQWEIVESLFDELQDSVLTVTRGNHNLWTGRHAGIDLQARIMDRFNFVDIGEGARLYLSLGNQMYVCMLRHRYRYNSAMNPGHAVMKMYDEHGPFDIGCIGHTHEAGVGWQVKQNKRVAWIRPGSYKVEDDYAESKGFPRSLPISPSFIIFPDTKKIMIYDDIEEAAEALTYYREKYILKLNQ